MSRHLRAFRADGTSLADVPKFYTQIPDDLDEDGELSSRPGPSGILRALLRLIRKAGSLDRSIVCTETDIAREAGVSTRTVRTHLGKLDRLKYISREAISGVGGQTGRRTRFTVTYQLRPNLRLEAEPTQISGPQGASNRKKSSASNRKKSSASNRKKSSGPSLFEQRKTTEEETTTTVVEPSSSFGTPPESESAAPPLQPTDLDPELLEACIARVVALGLVDDARQPIGPDGARWRITAAAREFRGGLAWVAQVCTIAERRPKPASGISAVKSWGYFRRTLAGFDREGRPIGAEGPAPPPIRVPPARQSRPAADAVDPNDPDGSKLRATLAEIRSRLGPRYAAQKDRPRVPLESPPRPAGALIRPCPHLPVNEHTVEGCASQEILAGNAQSVRHGRHPPDG